MRALTKISILILCLLVSLIVLFGYVFSPLPAWEHDLIALTFGVSVCFSCVLATLNDTHVRLDMFWSNFSSRQTIWIETLGYIFLLVPLFAFLTYASLPSTLRSWAHLETFGTAGGLPGKFIFKSLIPLLGVSMIIAGGFRVMRLWRDSRVGKF